MGSKDKLSRLNKGNARVSGDIDDIFSEIGNSKEKAVESKTHKASRHDLRDENEMSDEKTYFCTERDGRRYHDGLPVYTIEELQLNNEGGDTENCPIYCDCCT
ncbi:hypothetical protein HK407_03g05620 [Ordospora pajunii]|uniref:uncharacterized protein n=1 Tax=Ordospora pajunii TaxID=3039483 RepID=UPI002952671F|nr:uncharacterized protein HK407_03g05620 [Ordospora pajunii]KAH9411812.1 hypothetical protein HK407_03g05620 [Ordospora pajunii]